MPGEAEGSSGATATATPPNETDNQNENISGEDAARAETSQESHMSGSPSGEEQRQPEIKTPTKDTQGREINSLGSRLINRANYEMTEEFKDKPADQVLTSETRKKIYLAGRIQTIGTGDKPIRLSKDEPLFVTIDGKTVKVLDFTGAGGGNLSCHVEEGTGTDASRSSKPIDISREAILKAHLIAEKNPISGYFSGKEKELFEIYVDGATDSDTLGGKPPEEINKLIKDAAGNIGFPPTSEDIKILLERLHPDPSDPARQRLEEKLNEVNVVTPDILSDTMQDPSLLGRLAEMDQQITELQQAVNANPNDKGRAQELQDLILARKLYREVGTNGIKVYRELFNKFEEGQISQETGRNIRDAFMSGNLDTAIEAFAPELKHDPNAGEAANKEKEEKRERVKKKLLTVGGGLGILAILLLMAGAEMTKTMASQK